MHASLGSVPLARSWRWGWLPLVPIAVGVAIPAGELIRWSYLPLVSAAGLVTCALLLRWARRINGTRVSLLYGVVLLWFLYFPLRLLVVQGDRTYFTFHPIVQSSTDADFVAVWVLAVAGLAALVAGARSARRLVREAVAVPKVDSSAYAMVGFAGLAVSFTLLRSGASSGLFVQLGPLALFGIAALAYRDAVVGRIGARATLFVVAGVYLGTIATFKEMALQPVLAWVLGTLAGRQRRVPAWAVVAGIALSVVAFLGVQGLRTAAELQEPSNLFRATVDAVTRYDLRTGSLDVDGKKGFEPVTNVASAISRRTSGVEALLLVRDQVPTQRPYYRGETLTEPLLSLFPVRLGVASPEYPQLSLGRWFNTTFYAPDLRNNASQATTWIADLYMNFGVAGIAIGLYLMGLLIGGVDRAFPATTALGCGALAYVGSALVGIERNLAYSFAVTGIRLGILVLAIGLMRTMADRRAAAR